MIGKQIHHYKILEKLGAGGMGEVYLAEDTRLKRKLALKFLPESYSRDSEFKARFEHEAQAAAALNHVNIVTVYELGEHDGRLFIAMEHIEGRSLQELIEAGKLTLDQSLTIAQQICRGLSVAHQAGIVHRDIKPGNILVTDNGTAKILDFGLAKSHHATIKTKSGSTLGTVQYESPEQSRGESVDHRSDIFSLGVVLYEMIAGRLPFQGDYDQAIRYAVSFEIPEPLARYKSGVSLDQQHIVDKALAKEPEERYQSVAEMLVDLRRAEHELDARFASHYSDPKQIYLIRRRKRVVSLTLATLFALIIAVALIPSNRRAILSTLSFWPDNSEQYLVVLPFTGLGENPPSEAFLDGFVETLTSKLTQMEQFQRSLSIVPSSDVRRSGVTSANEARRAFGVTHAITGSIQTLANRIRITMNLVDARESIQLRSTLIDHSSVNSFALQDSTVIELASLMDIRLQPEHRNSLSAGGTSESQAYDFYLKGVGFFQRYTQGFGMFTRVDVSQLDSAIEMFQNAIEHDSHYALAYARLGEAYWRKSIANSDSGWIETAIDNTLHARELDGQVVSTYITLGLIHNGTGRSIEAAHDFRKALELDPLNVSAYRGLAEAYRNLNRLDEAESTYRKVINLKPDYIKGYYDLELFYLDVGRYDDARALLEEIVQREPEGFESWNEVGNMYGAMYYKLGEWDKAREIWERSLAFGPSYVAFSNLGTVYYMQSRFTEATNMYEKAVDIDDRDYRVWINLASAYEQIAEKQELALQTYRRAIQMAEEERKVNPRNPLLLAHLAECYVVVKDSSQALALAELALLMAPDNIEVIVRGGLVHEQLGKRRKALELIGKALDLGFPKAQLEALPELTDLLADPRLQGEVDR